MSKKMKDIRFKADVQFTYIFFTVILYQVSVLLIGGLVYLFGDLNRESINSLLIVSLVFTGFKIADILMTEYVLKQDKLVLYSGWFGHKIEYGDIDEIIEDFIDYQDVMNRLNKEEIKDNFRVSYKYVLGGKDFIGVRVDGIIYILSVKKKNKERFITELKRKIGK